MTYGERDEIEAGLRYVRRVRGMQPSAAAVRDLDRQEVDLLDRLRKLDQTPTSPRSSGAHAAHQRRG